jgi:hypothetical protein
MVVFVLETFGKRLKVCRVLADLSTKEVVAFIKENGGELSLPAYTRWEKGDTEPKKKTKEISLICDLFNLNKLLVSKNWLTKGEGYPPKIKWPSSIDESELFIRCGEEMENTNEWDMLQVNGSYGEPWVNLGDILLLQKVNDVKLLHSKLCLIRDISNNDAIGILTVENEGLISINNKNHISIKLTGKETLFKVKWIRKI